MELTTIRELYKNRDSYMDQKVTIGGWVRSIRGSKAFGFIVVNDGTFFEMCIRDSCKAAANRSIYSEM